MPPTTKELLVSWIADSALAVVSIGAYRWKDFETAAYRAYKAVPCFLWQVATHGVFGIFRGFDDV